MHGFYLCTEFQSFMLVYVEICPIADICFVICAKITE